MSIFSFVGKIRNWLSRITVKKIWRWAKKALVAMVQDAILDLVRDITKKKEELKIKVTEAKNSLDSDKIIDDYHEKLTVKLLDFSDKLDDV